MSAYTPVRFNGVKIEGTFWKERLETVLTRTIPSQHKKLTERHFLEAIKMPTPPIPVYIRPNGHGFTLQCTWDSDVGKWIEAASYALSHRRDAEIEARIEEIVDDFEKAQAPDGYLNTWYLARAPQDRWSNLRDNHELYNAGHMLEGAIAYYETTGRRRWLEVMERFVEHIRQTFGTGPGQKRGYCGHQEIELALIKLYRLTGERKHLDLATYFINERGHQPPHYYDVEAEARSENPADFWAKTYEYNQSHRPVREQDKVVGHAVRAMYMYSAMADLAVELDDPALRKVCDILWRDVMDTKMYITAGLGPSAQNEGFTYDYDLPNQTAYAETCASVALIFWAQRMLHLDLDGKYADVLERALYNGALSGLSHDGEHYFYMNPLESNGSANRWDWHTCPCCTMNVSRLVASVGGYFVSTAPDGIAFHLYGGISTRLDVGGTEVAVREVSNYPWSGDIAIEIDPAEETAFDVKLRIPGWCEGASAKVNGEAVTLSPVNGYATIHRVWKKGDKISLTLPMPAERIYANPHVAMDVGRVALTRGPLVYCLEEADNPGGTVQRFKLPRQSDIAIRQSNLFEGIIQLTAGGKAVDEAEFKPLYRSRPPVEAPASLTALPYYLWANRGRGSMVVWIPEA